MEHIIDIAKYNLDTYKAELASAGMLYGLTKEDYEQALRNITKLKEELEEFIEGE